MMVDVYRWLQWRSSQARRHPTASHFKPNWILFFGIKSILNAVSHLSSSSYLLPRYKNPNPRKCIAESYLLKALTRYFSDGRAVGSASVSVDGVGGGWVEHVEKGGGEWKDGIGHSGVHNRTTCTCQMPLIMFVFHTFKLTSRCQQLALDVPSTQRPAITELLDTAALIKIFFHFHFLFHFHFHFRFHFHFHFHLFWIHCSFCWLIDWLIWLFLPSFPPMAFMILNMIEFGADRWTAVMTSPALFDSQLLMLSTRTQGHIH